MKTSKDKICETIFYLAGFFIFLSAYRVCRGIVRNHALLVYSLGSAFWN